MTGTHRRDDAGEACVRERVRRKQGRGGASGPGAGPTGPAGGHLQTRPRVRSLLPDLHRASAGGDCGRPLPMAWQSARSGGHGATWTAWCTASFSRSTLPADRVSGEVFAIGDGDPITWYDFYDYFAKAMGVDLATSDALAGQRRANQRAAQGLVSGIRSIVKSPEFKRLGRKVLDTDPIGTLPRWTIEKIPATERFLRRLVGRRRHVAGLQARGRRSRRDRRHGFRRRAGQHRQAAAGAGIRGASAVRARVRADAAVGATLAPDFRRVTAVVR